MLERKIKEFKGNKEDGKNIVVLSGVHGNELTPISALIKLQKNIDIVLPYVNKITLIMGANVDAMKRFSRSSDKDFNRIMGEDHEFAKLMEEYVNNNDVIIDVHASPNISEFALINTDDNYSKMVNFCKKCNIDIVAWESNTNSIKSFAFSKDKVGITLELNGMTSIDEKSAVKGSEMIISIIKNIDLLDETHFSYNIEVLKAINSPKDGLIEYHKSIGDMIYDNEMIYTLYDTSGDIIDMVKSDTTGKIILVNSNNYVNTGDEVYNIMPDIEVSK